MGQDVKEAMTSTFHYGSIKIRVFLMLSKSQKQSTFHYGSIKMKMNMKNYTCNK